MRRTFTVEQANLTLPYVRRVVEDIVRTYEQWQDRVREFEVVTTGFTLLPQLILGTTRIATIQRRLAEFYARQMPLKIVRVPKPLPRLEEAMQWHAFRNADPGLLWLRRTLKGFAKRA